MRDQFSTNMLFLGVLPDQRLSSVRWWKGNRRLRRLDKWVIKSKHTRSKTLLTCIFLPQHRFFLLRNSALQLCGVEYQIDTVEGQYYSQAWLVIQFHLACLVSARACGGQLEQELCAASWMAIQVLPVVWSVRSRTIRIKQRHSPFLDFAGAQAWLVICVVVYTLCVFTN